MSNTKALTMMSRSKMCIESKVTIKERKKKKKLYEFLKCLSEIVTIYMSFIRNTLVKLSRKKYI